MKVLFLSLLYYLMLFLPGFVASPVMLLALSFLMLFQKSRRFALFAITLSLSASLVIDANTSRHSQNLDGIKIIGAIATEDGAIKKKGGYGFPASLSYGYDGYGLYSSLSGDVYIYGSRNGIRAGDLIEARGYFADSSFFLAESIATRKEGLFRNERKKAEAMLRKRLSKLGEEERNLSLMLLLALSDEGEAEITDLARNKGVSHVFALSGMHLSLISSFLVPVLAIVLKGKRAEKAAIIPLFIFTFLSGFRASLLRALLMRAIITFFPSFDSDDALSLTFIIHSALFPESMLRAGAVFSYLSLSGLVALSPCLERLSKRYLKLSLSAINASLSCLALTIPYAFYLFGSYTLSGIIYSPIINFIVTIYMGALLLYLIFPFFPWLFSLLYNILIKVLSLSYFSSTVESIEYYIIFILIMLFLLLLSLLHSK